jgi:hypothetical protein
MAGWKPLPVADSLIGVDIQENGKACVFLMSRQIFSYGTNLRKSGLRINGPTGSFISGGITEILSKESLVPTKVGS